MIDLVMAFLPLCAVLLSPVSGRLADRWDARSVATVVLCFLLVGIFFYTQLSLHSSYVEVAVALAFMGAGIGFFQPANQRVVFSSVGAEHYGVVSARLSSLALGFGTLGTTIAVALVKSGASEAQMHDPVSFSSAQQFMFLCLLSLAALAIIVSLWGRSGSR